MTVMSGHHQPSTHRQRQEEPPQRHVERRRSLLQIHIRPGQNILPLHPRHLIDDRRMRNRHTLRLPRRPRRENHIRSIRNTQRRNTIHIRNRRIRESGHIQLVYQHHIEFTRQHHTVTSSGQHTDRCRGLENMTIALDRMIRIQRHIRPTRSNHCIHTNHKVNRPAHRQRHQRLRPHAHRNQIPCKTVHPRPELRIRQRLPLEHHRHRIRRRRHLRNKPVEQQSTNSQLVNSVIDRHQHLRTLALTEQLHIPDNRIRLRHHCFQNTHQPLRKRNNCRRVEQIRRIRQRHRHPHTDAVLLQRRHRQLQIELRDLDTGVETGNRQSRQLHDILRHVLKEQRNLEQRMMGLRPRRIKHFHQTLERHVLVAERPEIDLTNPTQ